VSVSRPRVVLASTSAYRRALLERLSVPFECVAPNVDESSLPGESALALAQRLARFKAEAVAGRHPDRVVIGSDQVAVRGPDRLGKPGSVEQCIAQLEHSSGREVEFLTAVHVVNGTAGTAESHVDRTVVRFRRLSRPEIERYVAADHPIDCAGGFKAESLGIALFERIESSDPTGLTGLPLIWLSHALRRAGIAVP
jgi:7-methyl-GTP pyrophosphatase